MAELDTHAALETTVGTINRWTATGIPIALATVIHTHRSAPEPSGAKLAMRATGALVGAVSGGCVEGAVVTVLEDILAGGAPRLLRFGAADEDSCDVGLPCGGEIEIWT
jgi:xanthine dehydrogenase accessory factor